LLNGALNHNAARGVRTLRGRRLEALSVKNALARAA
jgi:hypothetical protein